MKQLLPMRMESALQYRTINSLSQKCKMNMFSALITFFIFISSIQVVNADCTASPQLTKAFKHNGPVNVLRLTSDYKILISGQTDGVLKIWNLKSSELTLIQQFTFKEKLSFSQNVFMWNDGAKIFVGGSSGVIKILQWNSATKSYMLSNTTILFPYSITTIWVMKNGTQVYVGMDNSFLGIQRANWNGANWKVESIPNISSNYQTVTSIIFSKDEQKMFIGIYLKAICILKYSGGAFIQDQRINQSLYSISLSADQTYITVNGIAKQFTVYMYNQKTLKYISIVKSPTDVVADITYGASVDNNNNYMVGLPNIMAVLIYYIYTVNGVATFIPYDKWQLRNTTGPSSIWNHPNSDFFIIGSQKYIFLVTCRCDSKVAKNCLQCTGYSCVTCTEGYALNNGKCQSCIDGYYQMNDICVACPPNCLKCQNGTGCSQCKSGFDLISSNCTACTVGYFKSDQICITCPNNCQACSNNQGCSICKPGFVNPAENCYYCASGYFKSNNTCIACALNCAACSDNIGCSACFQGYSLINGSCNLCSGGYYKLSNICTKCQQNCNTCADNLGCFSCRIGYSLPVSNCMTCASGYYKLNTICNICPKNCKNCVSQLGCTQCQSQYSLSDDKLCDKCAINYYKSNGSCVNCPSNCARCIDDIGCSACSVGFFLSNNKCLSCPQKCDLCSSQVQCNKCSTGFVLNKGKCCVVGTNVCNSDSTSASCLSGYYLNLKNRMCSPCKRFCSSCNQTTCTKCDYGYSFKPYNQNSQTSTQCLVDNYTSIVPNCNTFKANTNNFNGYLCHTCKNNAVLKIVLKNEKMIQQCILKTVDMETGPQCSTFKPFLNTHICNTCISKFLLLSVFDAVLAKTSIKCISQNFTINFIEQCAAYHAQGSPTYYSCHKCNNNLDFIKVYKTASNATTQCVQTSVLSDHPNCQILRLTNNAYSCSRCSDDSSSKTIDKSGSYVQQCVWASISQLNIGCAIWQRTSQKEHRCKSCSSQSTFKTVIRNGIISLQCVPISIIKNGPAKCQNYQPTATGYSCYDCILGNTLQKFSYNENVIYQCLLNKDIAQVFYCDVFKQSGTLLSCNKCNKGYQVKTVQPPNLASNVAQCVLDSVAALNDGCFVYERYLDIHQCKQCLPGMSLMRVYMNKYIVATCVMDILVSTYKNCYALIKADYGNYICHACQSGFSLLAVNKTTTTFSQQCVPNNQVSFVTYCYTYIKGPTNLYECSSCQFGRTPVYFWRNGTKVLDCPSNVLLESVLNCDIYLQLPAQIVCYSCTADYALRTVDRNRTTMNQSECVLSKTINNFNKCSIFYSDGNSLGCKTCEAGTILVSIYRNDQTDKSCVSSALISDSDKCDIYRVLQTGVFSCFSCKAGLSLQSTGTLLKCG